MKQKLQKILMQLFLPILVLLLCASFDQSVEAAQQLSTGDSVYFGNYIQERVMDGDEKAILKQYDSSGAFNNNQLTVQGDQL